MIVKCKICGLHLTHSLIELHDEKYLNEEDNMDFIPEGYFIFSDGMFFTNSKGKIIINRKDLINSKNHSDSSRLYGCCGLDGTSGVNKTCNNNHEIGTERSDCWMPHCVIFEDERIEIYVED